MESRAKHRVLGLCAGALAWLGGLTSASANSAAPYSRPVGVAPGVLLERPSPVVVEREDLAIDCTGSDGNHHSRCTFVATYHLRNPSANDEELLGAFYSAVAPAHYRHDDGAPPVAAAMDGQSVNAEATDEQLARMDEIVNADPGLRARIEERKATLARQPFRIVVPGGAKKSLVFSGELVALDYRENETVGGYAFPAMLDRHPFMGRNDMDAWNEGWDEFDYLISPLATWAGDPDVHVRIKHKSTLDFTSKPLLFTRESAGGIVTESTVIRAKSGQNLRFRIGYYPWPIFTGGPLVGIGPRIGRTELHTRFGYEFGIREYSILGAYVDTNFDNYLTAALTLDASTPNLIVLIPGLSFGAGPVAQFRRDTDARVGVRTQFGITFPIVSLTFPIDIYPVGNSSGSHVEGAFLTQLSF